jgi:hypothetical protein
VKQRTANIKQAKFAAQGCSNAGVAVSWKVLLLGIRYATLFETPYKE